jgi:hypothetical protein
MTEDLEKRELTKPPEVKKGPVAQKQLSIRMHPHEHSMLMMILKRDGLSFQKFYTFICAGYLNADPRVLSFLREQRELELLPQNVQDKHTLSWRERNKIFDEIATEKGEK